LTIELTPAQGAESLRSCWGDNLSYPPLRMVLHARAHSHHIS